MDAERYFKYDEDHTETDNTENFKFTNYFEFFESETGQRLAKLGVLRVQDIITLNIRRKQAHIKQ